MTTRGVMNAHVLTVATVSATVAWAVVLAIAALLPVGGGVGPPIPDWLGHGLGYGVQAGLIWAMSTVRRLDRWRAAAWSVGGATGLGALTEILQTMHPERSAEWMDLVADGVGAATIVFALELWRSRCGSRTESLLA